MRNVCLLQEDPAAVRDGSPPEHLFSGRRHMKAASLISASAVVLLHLPIARAAESAPPTGPVGFKITQILETTTTAAGQVLRFPEGENQLSALIAELAPGGQVGRHVHPVPLFAYILEGTLTVEVEGHGTRTFSAGEGFVDVVNLWHNGRNLGDRPVRFLVIVMGQKGTPTLLRP
jgi:quercetin dioxygenase-like cupin family protein